MHVGGDPREAERLAGARPRSWAASSASPTSRRSGSRSRASPLVIARQRRGGHAPPRRGVGDRRRRGASQLPISPGWALCCADLGLRGRRRLPARRAVVRARCATLAERWGARQLIGVCRSAYGSVLATGGDWAAAEAELTAAVDDLEASRPGHGRRRARAARRAARPPGPRRRGARAVRARPGPPAAACSASGELALDAGDAARRGRRRRARRCAASPTADVLDRVPALELLVRARAALGELDGRRRRPATSSARRRRGWGRRTSAAARPRRGRARAARGRPRGGPPRGRGRGRPLHRGRGALRRRASPALALARRPGARSAAPTPRPPRPRAARDTFARARRRRATSSARRRCSRRAAAPPAEPARSASSPPASSTSCASSRRASATPRSPSGSSQPAHRAPPRRQRAHEAAACRPAPRPSPTRRAPGLL